MIEKKSIVFDLILMLITVSLWNIWMQYRQIRDYNNISNSNKYSFFWWVILSIITFGLYHIYHEYKLTRDICVLNNEPNSEIVSILAGVASATFLWIFVDLYQQELLNRFISSK